MENGARTMADTDQEIKKVLLWFLMLAKRAVQLVMVLTVLSAFVVGGLYGIADYEKRRKSTAVVSYNNDNLQELEKLRKELQDQMRADPNYCQMADGSYKYNPFCKYSDPNYKSTPEAKSIPLPDGFQSVD